MHMQGFTDLHSHWIANIDDGVKSVASGIALLRGLYDAGFSTVVATPHMRPGMFDNDKAALKAAFGRMQSELSTAAPGPLPVLHLASEHFFDDIVFRRIIAGDGLPYPGGGAILVELSPEAFPTFLQHRFFDVRRAKLTPILAHPERYQPVWKDDACLDPLLDAGAHLLLDVCSLVGKYGKASQKAAEKLLADDAYEAACSDAHKVEDVESVVRAIRRLEVLVGSEEKNRLLREGPRGILETPLK
jgi:protein-tyrosine phosphatase